LDAPAASRNNWIKSCEGPCRCSSS
jgi:hypothetical protein